MPFQLTLAGRQWWARRDRETLYRTRRDALHARRGVSIHRILNRAYRDRQFARWRDGVHERPLTD